MRRERSALRSRQQTGILEGFWTIADEILRPNERPKTPIAFKTNTGKIRLKQDLR
jgi:hypothetical protein